jgi:HK97 family phage portal protein
MNLIQSFKNFWRRAPMMVKASAAQAIISMQSLGAAVWSKRDYAQFAEEGYKRNVVVFKAINELITAGEQAPWFVQRWDAATKSWLDDEECELAKLLRQPNPQQSGPAFFGAMIGFFSIAGNSYTEAVKPTPNVPPRELYNLRPDRMSVIPGITGPAGYVYKVGGAQKEWSSNENAIRHIKTFNPLDDWYGLSAIEAAAYDVDIHNAALQWNKSLLDNNAKPSGALVYAPKRDNAPDFLPDDQYTKLKTQITEMYSGKDNAGKPLLLEGGLQWVQFSLSPSDMDYINAKNTTARDICTAFGVPPQILGIPGDNTYSNMKEARQALWEQRVLPLLYKIRDEFNAWLAPQFKDAVYRIVLDEDDITALAPRREEKWRKLQDSNFLTINEKREALGYEEVDGGDVIYIPATLIPIGSNPFDTTTPAPVTKPTAEEEGT